MKTNKPITWKTMEPITAKDFPCLICKDRKGMVMVHLRTDPLELNLPLCGVCASMSEQELIDRVLR